MRCLKRTQRGSTPPTLLDLPDQLIGVILSLVDNTVKRKG